MEEATKLAKELIAIPSVSGGEAEILKFCADWFRGAEFDDVFTDDMSCVRQVVRHLGRLFCADMSIRWRRATNRRGRAAHGRRTCGTGGSMD